MDHEIKELNESNLKIEEDMMQLQTQVTIYSVALGPETQLDLILEPLHYTTTLKAAPKPHLGFNIFISL